MGDILILDPAERAHNDRYIQQRPIEKNQKTNKTKSFTDTFATVMW